jgi:hypothetical protein
MADIQQNRIHSSPFAMQVSCKSVCNAQEVALQVKEY